jgi:hypothetical protein
MGFEYQIFMHTYQVGSYFNRRTKEKADKLDSNEYKLLEPGHFLIENQDKVKAALKLEQYRTHKDPWNTKYNSVDNFILAQHSKLQIVKMIKKSGEHFDYVIFLRPDVKYIQKLKKTFFDLTTDNSICIPNFHLHGKYKINDRFAITNMATYLCYGEIFNKLLEISKQQPLHSETVIGRILLDMHKLDIVRVPFKFLRVRCDGRIVDR